VRNFGELADDAAQIGDAEVALAVHAVETGLLEQHRHRFRIARGICEARHLSVLGHANDECDALFGKRRLGGKNGQKPKKKQPSGPHLRPRASDDLSIPSKALSSKLTEPRLPIFPLYRLSWPRCVRWLTENASQRRTNLLAGCKRLEGANVLL